MKIKLFFSFVFVSCLFLSSCNREYKRTENGALMKFYTVNRGNEKPQVGDLVIVDVVQKLADSVVFDSYNLDEPFEILIEEPSFVGDIMCALLSMHLNDHASLVFPLDSMFLSIGEQVPEYIVPGTMTEMDIVLKDIIKKDVLEEEYRKELILRKNDETALLNPYFNQYELTEDSLVIVSMNNKKTAEFASAGNIMKVYFTFQTLEGDTLLSFTEGKPYELVFGDMALGQGFYEALGLVAKGGEAEFVIPSSLAFGSDGFYDAILPYTPFKLNLNVVDIMTSEEYEEEQRILKEEEEALKAKRLEEEPRKIAKYLKNNDIKVSPKSSGLYFIENKVGDGDYVQDGDMVLIHYIIYNLDGEQIESSYEYENPLPFVYGDNQMLQGIEEAVGYMRVGGKCRIIVPSYLGFGDVDIDEKLPANSTVVIDLEIVDLQR